MPKGGRNGRQDANGALPRREGTFLEMGPPKKNPTYIGFFSQLTVFE